MVWWWAKMKVYELMIVMGLIFGINLMCWSIEIRSVLYGFGICMSIFIANAYIELRDGNK